MSPDRDPPDQDRRSEDEVMVVGDLDIQDIQGPDGRISKTADRRTRDELEHWKAQQLAAIVEGIQQDTAERKTFSRLVFGLIVGWLAMLFILLILQGFGGAIGFQLSDNVFLGLIGGGTTTVIGLLVVVVKYLFSSRKV